MQNKSNKDLFSVHFVGVKNTLRTAIALAICTILIFGTVVLAEEHKPDLDSNPWNNITNREQSGYNQKPEAWANEGVDGLRANGLLGESMLRDYNKPLTRFEFAELVVSTYHKAAKIPYDGSKFSTLIFEDINNSHVNEAYSLGIVKGVGNNKYEPYSNIERQAVCVMLVRLLRKIKSDISTGDGKDIKFADEARIGSWAKPDVAYCYKNGIMTGVAEKTIDPLGNVTREQIYTLLYRFCVKYGIIEKAATDPGYYMLNGFKVPRDTKLEVDSAMDAGCYIILVGHFSKPETESQFEDIRSILISGGLSVELIDRAISGIKRVYSNGHNATGETIENNFVLGIKSDDYTFSISIRRSK